MGRVSEVENLNQVRKAEEKDRKMIQPISQHLYEKN
jgi:hypothetical protein